MPKIPTYSIGQARTQNVPDLQFGAAASPEHFGTSNFEAINNLANAVDLQGLAKSIQNKALRNQEVVDTTTAQNNLNTYNLGMLERQTELLGTTGYPAMESVKSYQTMSADLRKEMIGNLENNTQKAMFNASADKNDLTNLKAMYRFQEKAIGQFKLENTKADSNIKIKEMKLNYNDMDRLEDLITGIGQNESSMLGNIGLKTSQAQHLINKRKGAAVNSLLIYLQDVNPHQAKKIIESDLGGFLETNAKQEILKKTEQKILQVDTAGQVSSMIQIGEQKSEATRILAFQNKDKTPEEKTYINKVINQQYTQKANEVTQVVNEKLAKDEVPSYEELNNYQRFNPVGYTAYKKAEQRPVTKSSVAALSDVVAARIGFSTTGNTAIDNKNYLEVMNIIEKADITSQNKKEEKAALTKTFKDPKTSQYNRKVKNAIDLSMLSNNIEDASKRKLYTMHYQNMLDDHTREDNTPELNKKIEKYLNEPVLYDIDYLSPNDYIPRYLLESLTQEERAESKKLNKKQDDINSKLPRNLKNIVGIKPIGQNYYTEEKGLVKIYNASGKVIKTVKRKRKQKSYLRLLLSD